MAENTMGEAATDTTDKSDLKDSDTSNAPGSLLKDDSGIAVEAEGSGKSESEACDDNVNVNVKSTADDVDMCNDFDESLNDSAFPSSSSISESSGEVKYSLCPVNGKGDCSEEPCVVDLDLLDKKGKLNSEGMSELDVDSRVKKSDGGSDDNIVDGNGKTLAAATAKDVAMESVESSKEDESLSSLSSSNDEDQDTAENTPSVTTQKIFRHRKQKIRRRNLLVNQIQSSDSSSEEEDLNLRNDNDARHGGENDNDEDDDDILDSDDDDDDDDDDDVQQLADSTTDSDKTDYSDICMIATDILNKTPPFPNWFAVHEIRKREYGCTSRQSLSSFNEKVQGSIHMARRLQLTETLKYHEGCVNALCFNRIGTLLASGSDDLNVVLWNWQRGRPSLIYGSGHRSNVFQAKFMPYSGDCHVVSCARDGQVRLAELSLTGVCKTTRKLAQHKGAAHKLALEYGTPNVFLSCGEDAVTFLLDLREDRPHRLVTTKEKEKKVPLYSIHSNPSDPRQFCVSGRDQFIRVYDKRKIAEDVDGGVLKKLCPDHLVESQNKANATCACYNYNGTEILGSYNDEDIYLFDNSHSDGASHVHRYQGHRNNETVKGVNFYGSRSEFIVSGSDCGNLYIWEKQSEAIVTFQPGDKAGVINVLEPHPSLPLLATSGLDHDVKLWVPSNSTPTLDTGKLRKTVQRNLRERKLEMNSDPTVMSGQMLWMLMHHFRNTARRRLREEGEELSTSDEDYDDDDAASDDSGAAREINQCAQS